MHTASKLVKIERRWNRLYSKLAYSVPLNSRLTYFVVSFLDHIGRITASGYMPTITDILHIPLKKKGIDEHCYTMGGLMVQVYNVWNPPSRFKWIPLDLTAIIFNVNLLLYDLAGTNVNELQDVLSHFDEVVNTVSLRNTCIIVVFHHTLLFRAKLTVRPFKEYFPDYDGDPGYSHVEDYISNRFRSLDRRRGLLLSFKRVYVIFDNCRPSVLGAVNSVLKSYSLERGLREFLNV